MPNNPFLYFDIETGGLDPGQHSILSISHARGDQRRSLYARPSGPLSDWVTKNVWDPIRQRIGGDPTHSEEDILKDFLGTLQSHRGGTIAGWNVGYVATPMAKGTKGFDIPFIMSRAEKYGLHHQFGEAFQGLKIRDIGREFSVRIAQEVTKFPELVDPKLHAQAKSFTKLIDINRSIQRLHSVPEIAEWMGTPGKYGGFEVAGWKLGSIHKHLFGQALEGHHLSEQDVLATKKIFEEGNFDKLTGAGFVRSWNAEALLNKAAASAKNPVEGLGGTFYARAAAHFAENPMLERGIGVAGIGLGLATLLAVKPLQYFSGKDDNYNTIEGLPHKGLAGRSRRHRTDFGSGYQGDKKYERDVKERFSFFQNALRKYGKEEGTGHKRIFIPKDELTKEQIEDVLGFVPVTIAIPEAGQKKLVSYRNPTNLYHIHEYDKYWTMHEDRNAASTMLVKKWFMERTGQLKSAASQANTSIFTPIKLLLEGMPHVLEEGIPGAYYYLKGQLLGGKSMLQRLQEDLSPEYDRQVANLQEIRKDSWSGLKRAGRRVRRAVISGKDDAYNTIEGLRHGGLAEQKRHEMTDFGSGWVRRALSMGIAAEKVAAASTVLGKEMKVLASDQGSKWLIGREMGKGGMGAVSEAFEAGTGKAGIYKHLGPVQKYEEGVVVESPAFAHLSGRGGDTGIFPVYKQAFLDAYTIPASNAWRKTAIELGGGVGAPQEAALQSLAHQQYGSMVPQVYGHTETGIFMESAGRPIESGGEEKALRWLKDEWSKQLHANPRPGQTLVTHLDPQIKNIMKKGDSYKLIDWGVATTEQLSRESKDMALREYERYIQSRSRQVSAHRTAVELSSKYAKYGGKGHTKKSGVMPVIKTLIPTKVGG